MDTPKIKRIVFSETEIMDKVAELGKKISEDYRGKDLLLISILKGTFIFLADITRKIDIPVEIDFMSIGLYPGTTNQTGIVRITKDLDSDITGRHVLVIEDIIRTGLTIGYLIQNMESRKPASIKICTLLDNPAQRLVNIPVAYSGFKVPDVSLAGYGMDIKGYMRNLPYIAEVDEKYNA
ncbi:MAG: hypoxanthine phosphoribosyltransferase [Bacillota bacterium]